MVKYYWYINLDPNKYSSVLDFDDYIKRSLTEPPKKFYYIAEVIDGYNHIVTGKKGERILSINDGGNPSTIQSINKNISNVLKSRFIMDIENMEREEKRSKETPRLMYPSDEDEIMINSFRRKKRIKTRMDIKKPSKNYRRK